MHGRMWLVLTALALAWTFPAASAPDVPYEGAAALFGLEGVTVVYPALPEQDREMRRLSAEHRAAYLRHRHSIDTIVVADDAITAEQRNGNLLLLGWSNRLLGTEEVPAPFGESDGRRLFLGEVPVEPTEDLLFTTVSPYNPERRLVFWSRIDPELDRYLPMPFTGSDWSVFRDCTIMRQGMFAGSNEWPPRHNPFAEAELSSTRGRLRSVLRSPRATLHYDPQSMPEDRAQKILETRDRALARAIELVGDPGADFRVDVYVYANKSIKKSETDVADMVHSIPMRRELHMVMNFALSASPHEEIHLVARAVWGPCWSTALYEGLAVALDPPRGEKDLDLFAALLAARKQIPTLELLLDEEELRKITATGTGFPASGLLVRWIREVGGDPLLRRAYGTPFPDPPALARILERSATQAETDFRTWVEGRAAVADSEYRFRSALADARLAEDKGDRAAAVQGFEKALALRPEDPEVLLQLARAQAAQGSTDVAEGTLRHLIALEGGSPLTGPGHYELGRLLQQAGRIEEARAEFQKALERPDHNDTHRLAREALDGLSAEGSGSGAPPG